MANLGISISAAIGDRTWNGPNITDVNMDRFLDYIWDQYPQYVDPADPEQGLLPKNNANLAAAFDDFAATYWQAIKGNVIRWEKDRDAQVARDAIVDDIEA